MSIRSLLRAAVRFGRRLLGGGEKPFDPRYPSGIRVPNRRGPGGRSSAVAVEEPAEPIVVRAVAKRISR
jgi:hypothetical protein